MDWITSNVAIGNHLEARDTEELRRSGISSTLCLDGCLKAVAAQVLGLTKVEVFHLIDGPGNDLRLFQWAVASLSQLVAEHPAVLVHCHAGRSRSVVVVAGWLMKLDSLSPDEAIARVSARRTTAITPGLEGLLYW